MSKKLFKVIKNIHNSNISIAGTTIVPDDSLYVFMNPAYFTNNMTDVVSNYTQGFISIYDNVGSPISTQDVWDSIQYNLSAINNQLDVSDVYVYINTSTILNGHEFSVVCNPIAPILLELPVVTQNLKKLTIKNVSSYVVSVRPNNTNLIDGSSSDLILNLNDTITIKPIYETNTWLNIGSTSAGGGSAQLNPARTITFDYADLTDGIVTIDHGLNNRNCTYNIQDNNNAVIVPDNLIFTTNTAIVDLSSYGSISGTWSITIIANGGGAINTDWANVTNKPASFTPSSHGNEAHSTAYASTSTVTTLDSNLNQILSTGLISGFDISINTNPAKFDLSAGVGIIVDNYTDPSSPVKTIVSHAGYTALSTPYLSTDSTTYIAIDISGNVVLSNVEFTAIQLRTLISIGWIDHTDGTQISNSKVQPISVNMAVSQLNDFLMSFGSFNISGNEYHPNTGLTVSITEGKTFEANANYETSHKSPHILSTPDVNNIPINYYYKLNNTGDWVNDSAQVPNIDPNHWDNATGTLAVVPDGKWTIQLMMLYAPTLSYDFQYGQVVYDSFESAQSALKNAVDIDPYNEYDTFRGWLIVQKGVTDLTDTSKAKFIPAGKLGIIDVSSGGGTGGEINTASNIGTAGIGTYKQKLGVDLQFKNLRAISGLNIVDNTETNTIDFTVGGGSGAVINNVKNTTNNIIENTDYLIRYIGTTNIIFNLPQATGSKRFLRFVHAGAVNTSIILNTSLNSSVINGDTDVKLTKYDARDILAIEVSDVDTGIWELC